MIPWHHGQRYAVATALALFVLIATACGGEEHPDELVIPHSAIEALDNYRFISDVDISSAEQDFTLDFEGAFQAPDKIQGTLTTAGMFQAGRPAETEMIVVGERVWWREPGGEWQTGLPSGGDGPIEPFLIFSIYATPRWYIEALNFDSLRLPTTAGVKQINGVRAIQVRLNKTDLVGMLDQATFRPEEGKDVSIVREDVQTFLPEDIIVEAWITEDGLYPVRIIITLSADESDEFTFLFEKPLDIRLQMDITDPNADVNILPPSVD